MGTVKSRVGRLELEIGFRYWLWHARLLESLSAEQLEEYACLGRLPEPLPEPLPMGASKLLGLERKRLMQLWEEDLRFFGGRSKQELMFFTAHAHWPEQGCGDLVCGKARFDEVVRQHEARRVSMPT
jgi:hypothetical protein